jgi:fructose-bisphosphate aldolase, class I
MPILEPEVTISIADKAEAEAILQEEILKHLEGLEGQVMLKLSLPTVPDFYAAAGQASEGAEGRGAVGRAFARQGERDPGAEPRDHRQLQPGAERRASASSRTPSSTRCCKGAIDGIYAASIT